MEVIAVPMRKDNLGSDPPPPFPYSHTPINPSPTRTHQPLPYTRPSTPCSYLVRCTATRAAFFVDISEAPPPSHTHAHTTMHHH